MKKLVPILAVAFAALFTTPAADARGYHSRSYVTFHRSCGGPAWIETYVAYYDSCGHPVFRKRIVPVHRHACPPRPAYRPVRRHVPVCRVAPPVHHHAEVAVRIGGRR
ncbi:hypothetical protein [Luteolibacter marinus]|uniref:hypothetical protein n=1 Tax=Luteolibacter marinus TaxID=2776705 RepID=UPI001867B24F|nr:hypothetical protein [Luteolibacter marinus]